MVRPLTRLQQRENAAFLRELRRTGNAREAARALGMHRAKFTKRRAKHPAFAREWDAALVIAHASLQFPARSRGGGSRKADGGGGRIGATSLGSPKSNTLRGDAEPRAVRTANGRLQLRRAQPGRLDRAAEQRFLAALSACANVRLAAAAAGFTHGAFYARKRQCPAFAREWRLALQTGYDQVELALLEAGHAGSFQHDDWRRNDPPPVPPMTANQALQLMYLHQKEARLVETPIPVDRLRPGETWEARSEMLRMIREARQAREREDFEIAEAERRAQGKTTWADMLIGDKPDPAALPDLGQVTGWSKAKPHAGSGAGGKTAPARPAGAKGSPSDDAGFPPASGPAYDDSRALFGGWRTKGKRGKGKK